ncbi:hypothetical protein HN682_09570 [Candidatus Peregrinibacteria bacterium]|nr:hypothetical protein [Candidatus Peregrinibacteria bacterium]
MADISLVSGVNTPEEGRQIWNTNDTNINDQLTTHVAAVDSTSGHISSGSIVSTDATQTLTNKTIISSGNSVSIITSDIYGTSFIFNDGADTFVIEPTDTVIVSGGNGISYDVSGDSLYSYLDPTLVINDDSGQTLAVGTDAVVGSEMVRLGGNSTVTGTFQVANTSSPTLQLGTLSGGTVTPVVTVTDAGVSTTNTNFAIDTGTAYANLNDLMYVTGSQVGIGTSSPSRTLHVDDTGGARVGAAASYLDLTTGSRVELKADGTYDDLRLTSDSGSVEINVSSGVNFTMDADGYARVGSSSAPITGVALTIDGDVVTTGDTTLTGDINFNGQYSIYQGGTNSEINFNSTNTVFSGDSTTILTLTNATQAAAFAGALTVGGDLTATTFGGNLGVQLDKVTKIDIASGINTATVEQLGGADIDLITSAHTSTAYRNGIITTSQFTSLDNMIDKTVTITGTENEIDVSSGSVVLDDSGDATPTISLAPHAATSSFRGSSYVEVGTGNSTENDGVYFKINDSKFASTKFGSLVARFNRSSDDAYDYDHEFHFDLGGDSDTDEGIYKGFKFGLWGLYNTMMHISVGESSTSARVAINPPRPSTGYDKPGHTLDVHGDTWIDGDTIIEGSLLVEGEDSTLNLNNLISKGIEVYNTSSITNGNPNGELGYLLFSSNATSDEARLYHDDRSLFLRSEGITDDSHAKKLRLDLTPYGNQGFMRAGKFHFISDWEEDYDDNSSGSHDNEAQVIVPFLGPSDRVACASNSYWKNRGFFGPGSMEITQYEPPASNSISSWGIEVSNNIHLSNYFPNANSNDLFYDSRPGYVDIALDALTESLNYSGKDFKYLEAFIPTNTYQNKEVYGWCFIDVTEDVVARADRTLATHIRVFAQLGTRISWTAHWMRNTSVGPYST